MTSPYQAVFVHRDEEGDLCGCPSCDIARRERIKAFCRELDARPRRRQTSNDLTSSGERDVSPFWWETPPDNDNGSPRPQNLSRQRSYDVDCFAATHGIAECTCEWCRLARYAAVEREVGEQRRRSERPTVRCRRA